MKFSRGVSFEVCEDVLTRHSLWFLLSDVTEMHSSHQLFTNAAFTSTAFMIIAGLVEHTATSASVGAGAGTIFLMALAAGVRAHKAIASWTAVLLCADYHT